ncbi:MAG: long-chain N-acyl amino acid synthase [Rubrivivax sp.]|nr:long-chain N-acyl amino acid synthase [Rubrivivax sp.]
MSTTTIIAAPLESRKAPPGMLVEHARMDPSAGGHSNHRQFKIESADSFVVRQSVNRLIQERYGWRGYQTVSLPADQTANRITLTAIEDSVTIGTITVGLDGHEGMNCEDEFTAEIDALRARGYRVCEFTKLAIDPVAGTKRVLAALFHVAYIVAHRMRGYDALVMEVNPRHVRYYERMLGARVIGEERLNHAVNAPAVLLSIDFDYIAAQIRELGGQPERTATDRSLYPLAFTADEELGITARLMTVQKPASLAVN